MMAPLKVMVIGGGLAGSLIANGLVNHGKADVQVVVYERDNFESKRKGYQIRLGSSALVGCRACLTKEQFDAILARFGRSGGNVSSAPVLFNKNFELLLDLRKFAAYTKSAPINRARLRDMLQEPLREKGILRYRKQLLRYEIVTGQSSNSSRVKAHFADGTTDEGDVLIAADGNRSLENTQLGANNIVNLAGRQGVLSKADLPMKTLQRLPEQLLDVGSLSCVGQGMVMFCAVYMPDKAGVKPAKEATDAPIYDEEEASIMVGLQWETDPAIHDLAAVVDKKALMLSKIKDWDPKYADIVDVVGNEDFYVVQPRTSSSLDRHWRAKARKQSTDSIEAGHPRVWLMGDAIHPMLPSRGMGANQAMHDTADALPALLELAATKQQRDITDADVAAALSKYEDKMLPRAFKWVKKSGGTRTHIPDVDSLRGKIALFFIAWFLNVAGLFKLVCDTLGWKGKDDAPELVYQ